MAPKPLQQAILFDKPAVCITILSLWNPEVLRCGKESCLRTGGLQRDKIVMHMRPGQSDNVVMHRHRSCLARPHSHLDFITLEPGGSRTNLRTGGLQRAKNMMRTRPCQRDNVVMHSHHETITLEPGGSRANSHSKPQKPPDSKLVKSPRCFPFGVRRFAGAASCASRVFPFGVRRFAGAALMT